MAVYLSVDPGGSTGLCVYKTDIKVIEGWELTENDHHSALWDTLDRVQPDTIIYERFDWRAYTNKTGKGIHVDLSACEYIGVIRLWAQRNSIPVVKQQQLAHDKGLWTDEKLKRVGVLVEPASTYPHANDAIRHMLFYLTKDGHREHKLFWLNKLR